MSLPRGSCDFPTVQKLHSETGCIKSSKWDVCHFYRLAWRPHGISFGILHQSRSLQSSGQIYGLSRWFEKIMFWRGILSWQWRHGNRWPEQEAERSHPNFTKKVKSKLEVGWGCKLSKPVPVVTLAPCPKRFLAFPNGVISWETAIQIHEPMGAIFIQTTVEANYLFNWKLPKNLKRT